MLAREHDLGDVVGQGRIAGLDVDRALEILHGQLEVFPAQVDVADAGEHQGRGGVAFQLRGFLGDLGEHSLEFGHGLVVVAQFRLAVGDVDPDLVIGRVLLGELPVEDQCFLILALVEQLMGAQDGVAVRVAGHAGALLEDDADLRVGGDAADRLLRDAGGIALHLAGDLDHALAQGEESPLPRWHWTWSGGHC